MKKRCPQCKSKPVLVGGECPDCAWQPPKRGERATPVMKSGAKFREPLCALESGLLRCALPTTWWPDHRMRGYCPVHDEPHKRLGPGPELHAQLEHIRDHRADYIRDFYIAPADNWGMALVAGIIAGTPSMMRGPDEGKRDYGRRMLAESKRLGAGIRAKHHGHGGTP